MFTLGSSVLKVQDVLIEVLLASAEMGSQSEHRTLNSVLILNGKTLKKPQPTEKPPHFPVPSEFLLFS